MNELFPMKSSSRASLGKGTKPRENNIDECEELSVGSGMESNDSDKDRVNLKALEEESEYHMTQQNGENAYPFESLPETTGFSMGGVSSDYYSNNDFGLPRSKTLLEGLVLKVRSRWKAVDGRTIGR